jgi:alpha-galactosidase
MCCGTLSLVEEQTNMVMWSMFAAPLEIAADIRHMPNASASILLNKEVIAVNQDSLVQQGRRVAKYGGTWPCAA